ncbi:hypothetical protein GEMRC1_006117 [Eukaryota sp. GEM-RC1]
MSRRKNRCKKKPVHEIPTIKIAKKSTSNTKQLLAALCPPPDFFNSCFQLDVRHLPATIGGHNTQYIGPVSFLSSIVDLSSLYNHLSIDSVSPPPDSCCIFRSSMSPVLSLHLPFVIDQLLFPPPCCSVS